MAPVRSVAWRLKVEGDEIAVQKLTGVGSAARKAIEPVPGHLRAVSAASQEFQAGLSGLSSRLGTVGSALSAMGPIGIGVAAALGAVGLAAHQAFTRTRDAQIFGDDIEKSAQRLKLGTEAYQEIVEAARTFDIEQGEVNSGLAILRDNINQFVAGIGRAGGAGQAFKALGISRQDMAQAGTVERQLNLIADALSRVQNVNVREGIADRLGLTTLLPLVQNGSAAMARIREDMRAAGKVMDDSLVKTAAAANKQYGDLERQISGNLHKAFVGFSPITLQLKQWWADIATSAANMVQSMQKIEFQSVDFLEKRLAAKQQDIAKLDATIKAIQDRGGPGASVQVAQMQREAALAEADNIRQAMFRNSGGLVVNPDGGKTKTPLADLFNKKPINLGPTQEEINAAEAAAEKAAREQMQRAEQSMQDQDRLYEQRIRFLDQLGIAEQRSIAERVAAENSANVEMLRGKSGYYQALLKQANDTADAEIAIVKAQVAAQIAALDRLREDYEAAGLTMPGYDDARRRIEKGGDDQAAAINARRLQDQTGIAREARGAIGQLVDEITGPLDLAMKEVGANGLQTFTETLVGISTGARDAGEAIGDMVDSIISDMARMVLQRSIVAPLAGAMDGWLSGLFAGGHADGGSLRAGMFSRINERGGFPEAMVAPGGDVSILSSPTSLQTVVDAVRRQGGGGTTVMAAAGAPPKVEIFNMGEPLAKGREEYDSGSNTLRVDLKREVLNATRQDIRNGGVDMAMSDRFGARPARKRRE